MYLAVLGGSSHLVGERFLLSTVGGRGTTAIYMDTYQ